MKEIITISILALMYLNCSEEILPDCLDDFGAISYPVIAHSHNDYEQDVPITNALSHGFRSIEVDIAYDGSEIRVSHDDKDLSEKPEFEEMYLFPILDKGIGEEGLILLVDIKNYSANLIKKLNAILVTHEEKLVSRANLESDSSKLKIILSGEIPREQLINNDENRFLFIDGRLNNTDLNFSSDIVPIISLNISDISDSNATHDEKLIEVIDQVHEHNKLIRFWNTNDKESVWLKLIDLDVDIIGVDDIDKFCGVMKKNGLTN